MHKTPGKLTGVTALVVMAAVVLLWGGPLFAADVSVHVIAPETRYTPWLGLTLQEAGVYSTPGATEGTARGLVVLDVTRGGPADLAGLAKGDVILSLDGRLFEAYEDFSGWLREFDVGSTVKLLVDRAGEVKDVFLTLGSLPVPGGYGFLDPWLKDYLFEAGEYGGCNWLKGYHEHDMLFYSAFATLDLTDGQKTAAREVMSGFEKEMIRLSAELRVGEIELKELLLADEVDLKKVRAKIGEVSSRGAEAEYVRVKAREELKRLLSAEQRDRIEMELSAFDNRGWMWMRPPFAPVVPLPHD